MKEDKKFSILLIEDERSLRSAAQKKLEENNFMVHTAVSVAEAIEKIQNKKEHFDAVWLDHYLIGEEDGLDFLATVKRSGDLDDTPIFVVTNTDGANKRGVYERFNVTEYFVKADKRLGDIIDSISNYLENTP